MQENTKYDQFTPPPLLGFLLITFEIFMLFKLKFSGTYYTHMYKTLGQFIVYFSNYAQLLNRCWKIGKVMVLTSNLNQIFVMTKKIG